MTNVATVRANIFDKNSGIVGSAVGKDAGVVENNYANSFMHFTEPLSTEQSVPAIKFNSLKIEWEFDTFLLSSTTQISMHPAYQEIIGMGEKAIPLILNDLKQQEGFWFWALNAITGEDPVTPENRGNIENMTEAWLKWGEENGYI